MDFLFLNRLFLHTFFINNCQVCFEILSLFVSFKFQVQAPLSLFCAITLSREPWFLDLFSKSLEIFFFRKDFHSFVLLLIGFLVEHGLIRYRLYLQFTVKMIIDLASIAMIKTNRHHYCIFTLTANIFRMLLIRLRRDHVP